MRQTLTVRLLIVGFGSLCALFGWNMYPQLIRTSYATIINNEPVGWFMMILGIICIGMALGAEHKDD